VALEFWQKDYGKLSERYQLEIARPIINRVRVFYRNPMVKAIVCQPQNLNFRAIMDESKIFLASLAGEATQSEAATIGAMLLSQIQMAAMSRASLPPAQRRMFYLFVDEVQNFITTSLSVLFSEAAKYALSLTVANQYLGQLEGGTLGAILGNTGTMVIFACGPEDATDLGKYVRPVFEPQALLNLDRFQAVVKMQQHGQTLPAFSLLTPPPPEQPPDGAERAERVQALSHQRHAQPSLGLAAEAPRPLPSRTPVAKKEEGADAFWEDA
jgi:hypothetical protein